MGYGGTILIPRSPHGEYYKFVRQNICTCINNKQIENTGFIINLELNCLQFINMYLSSVLHVINISFTINILTLSLVAQLFVHIGKCPELYKLSVASGDYIQNIKRKVRSISIQVLIS
jgi:hypothetical protein